MRLRSVRLHFNYFLGRCSL